MLARATILALAVALGSVGPASVGLGSLAAAAPARAVPTAAANLPPSAFIQGLGFEFQSFNNCGPAAISAILRYYRFDVGQEAIRPILRPDGGYMRSDVIDPFVRRYGLRASRFTNGNLPAIRRLVARGIPVLVLQWLGGPNRIPHFRVVTGYDDARRLVWVSDSIHGRLAYVSYADFEGLWAGMSREMIPVYPAGNEALVAGLVGVRGPI